MVGKGIPVDESLAVALDDEFHAIFHLITE